MTSTCPKSPVSTASLLGLIFASSLDEDGILINASEVAFILKSVGLTAVALTAVELTAVALTTVELTVAEWFPSEAATSITAGISVKQKLHSKYINKRRIC